MEQKIIAVVAMGKNRVIGKKGWLPWPEMKCDYERLTSLASKIPTIMGRLSYESPKQFLSNNHNLIITSHQLDNLPNNCSTVSSKNEALDYYRNESEICVLGGQKVFESFLPHLTHIYITLINTMVNGDAYFPELSEKEWSLTYRESFTSGDGNPLDYEFLDYQREKRIT